MRSVDCGAPRNLPGAVGSSLYVGLLVITAAQALADDAAALRSLGAEFQRDRTTGEITGLTWNAARGHIDDADLAHLRAFPKLQALHLASPHVSEDALVARVRQLRELKSLHLSVSGLSAVGIRSLERSPRLQELGLIQTRISADGWVEFERWKSLQVLGFEACGIDDAGLASAAKLTGLQTLQIRREKITDDGWRHIAKLGQLRNLSLSSVNLTDAGVAPFAKLKQLETLRLEATRITDGGLVHLSDLRQLRELHLDNNRGISGGGLQHLAPLTKLTVLGLSNTQLDDKALKAVAGFPVLAHVNLGMTNISDDGVDQLTRLTALKSLAIQGSKLSPKGVARLRQALPECKIRLESPDAATK